MTFGERLYKLRKENKIKRKNFAKDMNLSYSTISKYENNERFPDKNTLIKIADYYSCSIDYLLGRIEEKVLIQEIGGEYLLFAKELEKNNINPKHLKEIIDVIKKM